MIGNDPNARFDVVIFFKDARLPEWHTDVSPDRADELERRFETEPEILQVKVRQRETEPADDDATDEVIKLTADVVLFGDFHDGRYVLLIERGWDPFKGSLALPGGHVGPDEETEYAAARELTEETGLRIGHLDYVGAYATPKRDPRGRYVTFAYAGRMPHRIEPTAGDDATRAAWVPLDDVLTGSVRVAFDHAQIIRDALSVAQFYHT